MSDHNKQRTKNKGFMCCTSRGLHSEAVTLTVSVNVSNLRVILTLGKMNNFSSFSNPVWRWNLNQETTTNHGWIDRSGKTGLAARLYAERTTTTMETIHHPSNRPVLRERDVGVHGHGSHNRSPSQTGGSYAGRILQVPFLPNRSSLY